MQSNATHLAYPYNYISFAAIFRSYFTHNYYRKISNSTFNFYLHFLVNFSAYLNKISSYVAINSSAILHNYLTFYFTFFFLIKKINKKKCVVFFQTYSGLFLK